MKKLIAILLIAASLAAFAACAGKGPDPSVVDISTPEPTSPVVPVPTEVPHVTEAPTAEPTPETTPDNGATQPPAGTPDQSVFDDAVFIGNSVFDGLYMFGVITHGKFFTKTSLNVNSVYTEKVNGGSAPILDEVSQGSYKKAILLFGQNELGWPSMTAFIQKYSDLIDELRSRQPGITVYITLLPPISRAKEQESGELGITLANINKMNDLLVELAERRGAYYIDVPESMVGEGGYLPDDASSDGMHLNLAYDRIWADHITLTVMQNS
ncbi:MAG: hypothetical protein J6P98_07900 [Clostridia bacterium]|nr:hypothetical protein [Clostridia bacterium]